MRAVIVAAFAAFILSILLTPIAIKVFTKLRADQPIRSEGPVPPHLAKKGTPTMGGVAFILATLLAYLAGHLVLSTLPDVQLRLTPAGPTATGIVLLGLFLCTGALGFLDDYLKVSKKNSLGLNKRGKLIGQALVGAVFGVIALYFPNKAGGTVGSTYLSFVKEIYWLEIGKVGAVLLFVFVVMSMSNAVNLTDGLDGLATGASVMVIGAYALIGFWQYRHWEADKAYSVGAAYSYNVRDPLEVAIIAAAAAGALAGFLWWNTSPARIFMGDTGALALGSLIAGLAYATNTVLLVPILGLLFLIIVITWVMQIGSFRMTGRRIFRMVPLQHHFELAGWSEVNIVVRFWIIAGLGVAIGIGLFYADFLRVVTKGVSG
ncbi:phospho-N-acetylmuramoyl-pentapeptide-transferase [Planosporangium mesophilum]|uniref:Phospho-N-acetylmuramoyl-pentapeptide-transferase n=1 Tax=Planosporangium mesophilum TaxID=689768 RepID=A0A8J3WZ89_9ACTN|nr:phospho-N-acetylmuramoyl-pentapeptide-transferase [Planosporangium mesophilum]NJC83572.1 phospho-N-acetylmuramoyl-pentapeptide-transferase [Planosporangium mesophilum]GII22085.1 phospho-N-acetylmuramoyl-pentapeptide-transferase [Planosporangium mesophilum]